LYYKNTKEKINMNKRTKASLKAEYAIAKRFGFKAAFESALERNPYLRLTNGECLVWLPGQLLMLTDTAVHFGDAKLYLRRWVSDHKNLPYATVVSNQRAYMDGELINKNENYYRVAARDMIEAVAKWRGVNSSVVEIDHKNRMRGDNRRCNLRPADAEQNNWNKTSDKIEKAFYTVEDLIAKLASGEWVPEDAM
jgi:hypothetical protein